MRYTLLIATIYCITSPVHMAAQWGLQPTNPFPVCNASGDQFAEQAFPDGSGGLYVLWLDDRVASDSTDIYGQHYDVNGNKLWEDQGRLILNDMYNIDYFRIHRSEDGKMILVWNRNRAALESTDGLYAQEVDQDGAFVWSEPLLLAFESASGSLSAFSYDNAWLMGGDGNYLCVFTLNTFGYNRIRKISFSGDGLLSGNAGGVEIGPISFGSMNCIADGYNGAYVYYTSGNGLGAFVQVMRLNESGQLLWPEWAIATTGTLGVGYDYTAVADPNGFTLLFEVNMVDLWAVRLDTMGVALWPNGVVVCDAEGSSSAVTAAVDEQGITVVWRDTRPGAVGWYAVYGQRLDWEGNALWQEDGLLIANDGGFDPMVRVFPLGNGEMAVSNLGVSQGVSAEFVRKMDESGAQLFGDSGIVIAQGANAVAASKARVCLRTAENSVAVWSSLPGGTNGRNVYISRFEPVQVSVVQELSVCGAYELNGDVYVESGTYEILLPGDTLLTLILTVDQLSVSAVDSNNVLTALPADADAYAWYTCGENAVLATTQQFQPGVSGHYEVVVTNGACTISSSCVEFVYVSIENESAPEWSVFPNPSSDVPIVRVESQGELTVFDLHGRVLIKDILPAGNHSLDVMLPMKPGLYILQWLTPYGVQETRWQKL